MPALRVVTVLVLAGFLCGIVMLGASGVRAQTLPSAAGPQQMVPYGSPTTYPSTSYPSASAGYPSTATPSSGYENTAPWLMASAPNGAFGAGSPTMPVEPGLLLEGGLDDAAAIRSMESNAFIERALNNDEPWSWQLLPSGFMFQPYLAGPHEPRFATQWVHERTQGWLWDVTLGGRAGLIRFGTESEFWPQGWQIDIEGAAFPRLTEGRDLLSNDYRFGVPLTTRQGPWEAKIGYYHFSSHIGDEYLLKNPAFPRLNYVRESLVLALAYYLGPTVRLYSEAGYAFYVDDGAKPWEFQFGVDCSPAEPTGLAGAPFLAINSHLRQENDFGGNMTLQTGWQWRGRTNHLFRIGMQYFNGMSEQCQFYDRFEEQIGAGIWYDY